ncbi:cytochrome P450 72A15-like [Lolium rigidum]|uniref:cytochrome P450 72A15-like n=1 Tax=Lolium rigidum TaxID=89674 RepID=UPI001F5CC9EB|nr:cytochrome P450 72A15-like [Lolium rigidum]
MSPAMLPWSFLIFTLLWQAAMLLDRMWLRPRRLERALLAQGLPGRPYRPFTSDAPVKNQQSPMPLGCHDIVPYVVPLLHGAVQECVSWNGPVPTVTIVDARLTREVMFGKSGHFEKLPRTRVLSRLLTNGLPRHEGEKWVKHRKILGRAFHLEKLKLMLPAFSSSCQELVTRWIESLASNLEGWCEVDVCPEFLILAADTISRTAFGSSYLEGRRILTLQSEQVDRIKASGKMIFIPGYMSLPTKNNRRMREINNEIESVLEGIIAKKMQAMQEGESTECDLLSLMLEPNMGKTDGNGRSAAGMTIEDVMEECKMCYLASTETPPTLLAWTMILLSMHPEWQDRAREEVLGLFGKNRPEYAGFSRLRTVTMILYEVLRLYPPAIAFHRKTYNETELGGITYPAGVVIEMPLLLIHHDPNIWGADVHEFRPDRFSEGISKASNDPSAFLPFGWGPRICIGQNFVLFEAKMAVCMILQHFEFELAPTYTHAPHNKKILRPMHGAQIKLRALV